MLESENEGQEWKCPRKKQENIFMKEGKTAQP